MKFLNLYKGISSESGSIQIYSCLATYLQAKIVVIDGQSENKNVLHNYRPSQQIPESPLMLKGIGGSLEPRIGQIALWINTRNFYVLIEKELSEKISSMYQFYLC